MNTRTTQQKQKGFSLLETVLALGILGVIAVAFFSGLATGAQANIVTDKQTTAENLARTQLEYVKKLTYVDGAGEYPVDPSLAVPASWNVLPAAVEALHTPDNGIQKITITVQRNGETVFEMSGYKTN